jgi:O-acetyl-ADP-ribose deacetylase (regulator of RNase III)
MKIILVDTQPSVTEALTAAFGGAAAVTVWCASIFAYLPASAIVSPANSFGWMDGGIDMAYASRWPGIEPRVQETIALTFGAQGLPVGAALTVPTYAAEVPWLIVAPTMRVPEPVSQTRNAYMAFRAALQQARLRMFDTVLCPGLATLSGRMHPIHAARQMRQAYNEVCP